MVQRSKSNGDAALANMARPALREVVERYRPGLVAHVRRKVADGPPDPADIAQQALANYVAMANRDGVKQPEAFLKSVANNLIADYFKSAAVRYQADVTPDSLESVLPDDDQFSPELVLMGKERFNCVLDAMRKLPRRQRRFLILNRIDGLSYTAIAARNGVSNSTARREVEAAVEACRAAIAKLEHDDNANPYE